MANVAQTVNCIHSLFLAHEDQYTRTPPYYVFEMYRAHMGARSVPMEVTGEDLTVPLQEGTGTLAALLGSASIRDKRLTVTLTNPSVDSPVTAILRLSGGAHASEARAVVLTHDDMRGRNTFDHPDQVAPTPHGATVARDGVTVTIPKHSVVAVDVQLA